MLPKGQLSDLRELAQYIFTKSELLLKNSWPETIKGCKRIYTHTFIDRHTYILKSYIA